MTVETTTQYVVSKHLSKNMSIETPAQEHSANIDAKVRSISTDGFSIKAVAHAVAQIGEWEVRETIIVGEKVRG